MAAYSAYVCGDEEVGGGWYQLVPALLDMINPLSPVRKPQYSNLKMNSDLPKSDFHTWLAASFADILCSIAICGRARLDAY